MVGRIALVYHLAEGQFPSTPIQEPIIKIAISLGRNLIEHAKFAYNLIGESEIVAKSQLVLEKLQKKQIKEVKPREIARQGWAGCRNVDDAKAVLTTLEKHGYLVRFPAPNSSNTGRPPSPTYLVNPIIYSHPNQQTETKEI